jgi:hypothetical protein
MSIASSTAPWFVCTVSGVPVANGIRLHMNVSLLRAILGPSCAVTAVQMEASKGGLAIRG